MTGGKCGLRSTAKCGVVCKTCSLFSNNMKTRLINITNLHYYVSAVFQMFLREQVCLIGNGETLKICLPYSCMTSYGSEAKH